MNEKYFTITKDSKENKYNVLFTFNKNNINYIIYTNNEEEILASRYKLENNNLILEPIETTQEWDMIDKELNEYYE